MEERKSKGTRKRRIDLIEYESFVPDSISFKSLQVRLTGWIFVNAEVKQKEFEETQRIIRHRVKKYVQVLSRKYPMFRELSIVDLDTGVLDGGKGRTERSNVIREYQFFKLDLVLFTRPGSEYDKYFVEKISEEVAIGLMEVLDLFEDTFKFIKNPVKEKRQLLNERE